MATQAQFQEGQPRTNRRTGEVQVFQNGQWVTVTPPSRSPQTIQTRPADPRLPYQVQQARNDAAASDVAPDRAAVDLEIARANATKAQADAARAQSELQAGGGTPEQRQAAQTRQANMEAASNQLLTVANLYRDKLEGRGVGSIFQSLPDFMSPTNSQFNAAAAGLSDPFLAAMRVPGAGTQSDMELSNFIRGNEPSAQSYDTTIEQRLDNVQNRLNEQRRSLGLAPLDWRNPQPAAMPGADRSSIVSGTPSGARERELSGGQTTLQVDPVLRGISGRLGQMIARGATEQQIHAFMREAGVNPADTSIGQVLQYRNTPEYRTWRQQHPNSAYPIDESFYTREVPQSGLRSGFSAASQSVPGAYAISAGNALTGNRLDDAVGMMGGNAEQARAGMAALREERPFSSLAGDISGGALAYAGGNAAMSRLPAAALARFSPAWRSRVGDAAYGAYSGSGDDNTLLGTVASVGGGAAGRNLVRGTGAAVRGVTDPTVRYLADRGVPLTLGQIVGQGGRIGQAVRGIEDRLSGVPGAGAFVGGQQRRSLEGFNRAAFNEAVEPIGGRTDNLLGEAALERAGQLRSGAYDNALGGVNLQVDPQLTSDLGAARIAGRNVPMSNPNQFDFTMATNVDPFIASPSGFSGRDFQTAIRGVRRARSGAQRELNGYEFGQALGQVEDALTGAVNRQAPDVMPALGAANEANRRISTVREALRPGVNQVDEGAPIFTPAQLGRASISNTTRYGGRDAAMSSRRPFFELQRAGQEILPNSVGDSGTAGRLLVPLALGGALGGAGAGSDAIGLTDNGAAMGLAGAAALSAPYTNLGQRGIQAALLRRPPAAQRIGDYIVNGLPPRIGGIFGATLGGYPIELPAY